MPPETVAVIDFGSQYSQLIARRIRENHVHSVLCGPQVTAEQLSDLNIVGLVFSGGPSSVYDRKAPRCTPGLLDLGVPVASATAFT